MQAGRTLFQSMLWRGLYYVAAFVINILIARHFQASVSGDIYYLSSIYALVLLFFSLSLESGIIYFASQGEIPLAKLFNFSVVWSSVIGLLTFLSVYYFFKDTFSQVSRSLVVFSATCFIFGNLLATYCSAFFYAHNNFAVPNAINISCTILIILVLPFNGKSIIPSITNDNYFYVYFGSYLVQGICMAVAVRLNYVKKIILQFLTVTEFRMLFHYCGMAFAGNIIYFLLYRIDYWFVARYCTAEQLGNYIQVSKLGHLFFILPTILASAVFPITAGGRNGNINRIIALLSRAVFFIYLLACILLIITGQWLFPYVFGETFGEMYQPFLFLIPGILSLSGLFTLTAYFAGRNKIKTNIIGSVYALAAILAGDIIFIPVYGINAAALVSSIGYIIYQSYILFIFKKEFNVPLNHFFIVKISDFTAIRNSIIDSFKGRAG